MERNAVVGLLYESGEWSDHKLASEIQRALDKAGGPADAVVSIFMESPDAIDRALQCDFLVSRVFASAAFRGHSASLAAMERLVSQTRARKIPLLNPGRAHGFEVSKRAAAEALRRSGIDVPAVHGWGAPATLDPDRLPYPCLIKPDCGGRTTHTAILDDVAQARDFLGQVPNVPFIVEDYIEPERGFVTRIEIVDGKAPLVVKRSVVENGLSAYRMGSRYEIYDDCPQPLIEQALRAATILDFTFGSFDVIETVHGAFFIDANSVSNVSEDCTALFDFDLMAAYGDVIADHVMALERVSGKGE